MGSGFVVTCACEVQRRSVHHSLNFNLPTVDNGVYTLQYGV